MLVSREPPIEQNLLDKAEEILKEAKQAREKAEELLKEATEARDEAEQARDRAEQRLDEAQKRVVDLQNKRSLLVKSRLGHYLHLPRLFSNMRDELNSIQ